MADGIYGQPSGAMIRAQGPFGALDTADLRWSERDEPRSTTYDDCYFSAENGLAETRHVFIDGSKLRQRFAQHGRDHFTIAELGFGTGLNFLQTWRTFRECAPEGLRLQYWSVDKQPLQRDAMRRALARWSEMGESAEALLAAYPPPLPGIHRRFFDEGRVILDLVWAEARDALEDLVSFDSPLVDAWYLDGFAPSRNDAMWTPELLRSIACTSRDGASVATYSAAGSVRRGLSSAGFNISKQPGFGNKRECLRGTLDSAARPAPLQASLTPWDLWEERGARPVVDALVIGAGLAGAHAAAALARRGARVTVLDAGACAGRGSGNAQGVLFTRLSHERSLLSDFSLLAFLHARDCYRQLFAAGKLRETLDGSLSGCVHTEAPRGDFLALANALEGLEEIAELRDAQGVDALLGVATGAPGFWQPGSGWLSPPAVCRALLEHDNIRLLEHCGPLELAQQPGQSWKALNLSGQTLASAEVAVIAAGTDGRKLTQLRDLPLRVVRGQTTQIPAPGDQPLQATFCHRGYIAPTGNGEHCIGATFAPGDESLELRDEDHRANLEALALALPGWRDHLDTLSPSQLSGRAELRCVSPDYLPLAGPVPQNEAFLERFSALQWDAKQHIAARGAYWPGLYLSTAHGSRGLSYAALCAELVASQVYGEAIPLSRQLQRALSPARFLIRDLIRGKSQPRSRSA